MSGSGGAPVGESQGSGVSGTIAGRYELIRRIGEGGYGEVYLARQHHPVSRDVAIKLLRTESLSGRSRLRFEVETQALGLMNHPNICRVLDAGALDDGRPYCVMEWVDGLPITDYCWQNRLPLEERLALLAQVCRAVHHAHQQGVIHRDLKPRNILVCEEDGRAVPKVIDFGLAKALGPPLVDQTLVTQVGQVIGTPEYMSPEQANGMPAGQDVRSDVYSLGIVLYELLTGTTPLQRDQLCGRGIGEIARLLHETEPERASLRLRRQSEESGSVDVGRHRSRIRTELDWVVLKALARDSGRRYASVDRFREDIDRYLSSQPVSARAPSLSYRLTAWTRRNRAALIIGVLLALAVGGTVVGAEFTRSQIREEARREREQQLASLVEQARDALAVGQYVQAEENYARALGLDASSRAAREGIEQVRRKRDIARTAALAREHLAEGRRELALGVALSARQRYPDNPDIQQLVDMARGIAYLRVATGLGTLHRAVLVPFVEGGSDRPRELDPVRLLDGNGVVVPAGLHRLELLFGPASGDGDSRRVRYIIRVGRGERFALDVREVRIRPGTYDNGTGLAHALQSSRPGQILLLEPGEHDGKLASLQIPNLRIRSADPNSPAVVRLYKGGHGIRVERTWDVALQNVIFTGTQYTNGWPGELWLSDSLGIRVDGCTFRQAAVEAHDLTILSFGNNRFTVGPEGWVHRRLIVSGSRHVHLVGNEVEHRDWPIGWRGLVLRDCRQSLVAGNRIGSCALTGLQVERNSREILVVGNRLAAQGEDGVRLSGGKDMLLALNDMRGGHGNALSARLASEIRVTQNILRSLQSGLSVQQADKTTIRDSLLMGKRAAVSAAGGEFAVIDSVLASPEACLKESGSYWHMIALHDAVLSKEITKDDIRNVLWQHRTLTVVEGLLPEEFSKSFTEPQKRLRAVREALSEERAAHLVPDWDQRQPVTVALQRQAARFARLESRRRLELPDGLDPTLAGEIRSLEKRIWPDHRAVTEWLNRAERREALGYMARENAQAAIGLGQWRRVFDLSSVAEGKTPRWESLAESHPWVLEKGVLRLKGKVPARTGCDVALKCSTALGDVYRVRFEVLRGQDGNQTNCEISLNPCRDLNSAIQLAMGMYRHELKIGRVKQRLHSTDSEEVSSWQKIEIARIGNVLIYRLENEDPSVCVIAPGWTGLAPSAADDRVLVHTWLAPDLLRLRNVQVDIAANAAEVRQRLRRGPR